MPRLNTVTPDAAEGRTKEIYDDLQKKMGKVINIFQGMGNSAAALNAYLSMSGALKEGDLSAEDREAIYLAVSERNGCEYCVAAHTAISKKTGLTDDQIIGMRKSEPSSEKHQALLTFVRRVQETKGFVDDGDIENVRNAGYTDGQIAETIAFIGLATYSNFFNHVYGTELDFPQAPSL